MDPLHTLLDEAARDAPAPPATAADLWDRGRRITAVRRRGTAAIVLVCCLLLGVIGLVTWHAGRADVPPAGSHGRGALPTYVHRPSPWLAGTDGKGPLGRLAVLFGADRDVLLGSHYAPVGISAATGEYRYLDLPRLSDAGITSWSLSPDGRRVAYWYTGAPSGDPNTDFGQARPVAGIAVYDTVSGRTRYLHRPSRHGLAPQEELVWVDADHLVFSEMHWLAGDHGDQMKASTANGPGLELWDIRTTKVVPLPSSLRHGSVERSVEPALFAEDEGSDDPAAPKPRWRVLALVDGRFVERWDLVAPTQEVAEKAWAYNQPILGPGGRRLAGLVGSRYPSHIGITDLGSAVATRPVPGNPQTMQVVTWLDDAHLATVEVPEADWAPAAHESALYRVEVRSGARSRILTMERGTGGSAQFAVDLLGEPPVHRARPPKPISHRTVAILIGLVVVAGLAGVIIWRRRARA